METRWKSTLLLGASILAWTSAEAGAQEPCPPFVRPRGDWGPSYQEPDTLFLLNAALQPNDPKIRIGPDGIHWTYHGNLLAVRWERSTLTPEALNRFVITYRALLRGALPDSIASRTTCVFSFPVAPGWEALDSVALAVLRWPGVLAAEPVRSGRWVTELPRDSSPP